MGVVARKGLLIYVQLYLLILKPLEAVLMLFVKPTQKAK